MSSFIRVSDKGGSAVYVNVNSIVTFEDNKARDSIIIQTSDGRLFPLEKSSKFYSVLKSLIQSNFDGDQEIHLGTQT